MVEHCYAYSKVQIGTLDYYYSLIYRGNLNFALKLYIRLKAFEQKRSIIHIQERKENSLTEQ